MISVLLILVAIKYGYCNAIELEDREFIIAIGIDNKNIKQDKNQKNTDPVMKVTTLSADIDYFQKKSYKSNNKYVKSALAQNLNQGLNKINSYLDKNIYLGHTQILFINKRLFYDKKYISKIINDIENNSHINQKIKILFVDNAKKTINSQFTPDLLKHIKNKLDKKTFDIRALSRVTGLVKK